MAVKISMAFQEVVKAREFNQFLAGVIPVGVYTNQESCLSVNVGIFEVNANTILYVPTKTVVDGDYTTVRVEFTSNTSTSLGSSPTTPYIMATVVWVESMGK